MTTTFVHASTLGTCGDTEAREVATELSHNLARLDLSDAAHEDAVNAFLQQAAENDPERFVEVCEESPVTTRYGFRAISEREVSLEAMVARYGENGFMVGGDSDSTDGARAYGSAGDGRS